MYTFKSDKSPSYKATGQFCAGNKINIWQSLRVMIVAMYGRAGNSKSLNLSMLLFTSTNKEFSFLMQHKQETSLKCKETELHCYHYDRIVVRILIKLNTRNHLAALWEDDLSRLKVYKRSLSCVERKPFDFTQ